MNDLSLVTVLFEAINKLKRFKKKNVSNIPAQLLSCLFRRACFVVFLSSCFFHRVSFIVFLSSCFFHRVSFVVFLSSCFFRRVPSCCVPSCDHRLKHVHFFFPPLFETGWVRRTTRRYMTQSGYVAVILMLVVLFPEDENRGSWC